MVDFALLQSKFCSSLQYLLKVDLRTILIYSGICIQPRFLDSYIFLNFVLSEDVSKSFLSW